MRGSAFSSSEPSNLLLPSSSSTTASSSSSFWNSSLLSLPLMFPFPIFTWLILLLAMMQRKVRWETWQIVEIILSRYLFDGAASVVLAALIKLSFPARWYCITSFTLTVQNMWVCSGAAVSDSFYRKGTIPLAVPCWTSKLQTLLLLRFILDMYQEGSNKKQCHSVLVY